MVDTDENMDPTTPGFVPRGTFEVEDAAESSVPRNSQLHNHPHIGEKVSVKQLIEIANCKLRLSEDHTLEKQREQ